MEADRHRYLHHYCNHYTRQHRRRHQLVTAAAAPSKTHCSVASAGPHLSTSITALEGEREKLYSAGRHRSQGAGDAIRSSFKCEGKTGYSGCRIRPNVCELEHDFRSSNDENDSHDILECERSDYTKTCKENRNCDRVNDRKEIKVERRARNNFFIEPKKDKTGRPEHIAITKRQENRAEESQDRRNYYLDLAGVENTSSRLQNNSRSSHAHAGCSRRRHRGHHRSRSHDLATFHLPGSADAKFASGPSCDAANNFLNSDKEKECLCKNTITDKCENLLFSAVAFGLSLAAETPQAAEKCDTNIERQEEHTRVGNNVVQMVTTSSNKVLEEEPRNKDHYHYAEQMLIRAQSKVFDPYDVARESGEQEERKHYIRKQQNFHQDDDKTGARSSSIRILQDSMRTTENSKQVHYSQNGCDSAAKDTMRDNSNYCRGRPLSLSGHAPVCVSPHPHRRHRHRDKDYSQAMRQVAQWIEQEQHAWDQEAGAAAALGDKIPVQRHEHHHIHEHHHHHHYHHYHET
ncbi:naked cuticle-like protein [Plakobranchus ocellatus]|uniref:Protein naked cuticle homolog n=1 Tax=Plakobranchus ocellatus TaxID=259542 RepID=A0AAV3ZKP4_9GAST|nr:naked cuticle-like protein [Plakobranchus ocellatus]